LQSASLRLVGRWVRQTSIRLCFPAFHIMSELEAVLRNKGQRNSRQALPAKPHYYEPDCAQDGLYNSQLSECCESEHTRDDNPYQ
jgi:hypothetical protein